MRLIDADDYCENICRCNKEGCDKGKCPIHNAPTAYDLDKVMEQLEENQEIKFYFDGRPPKQTISYEKAIEIVKAGGAE